MRTVSGKVALPFSVIISFLMLPFCQVLKENICCDSRPSFAQKKKHEKLCPLVKTLEKHGVCP